MYAYVVSSEIFDNRPKEGCAMGVEETLAKFGIHGKQARFYLAALELGEAPVHQVAQKAGISRTTAYDVLAKLLHEGLVTQVQKAGRYHVIAEDPARLLHVLDDRRRTVEEVLPELRSIFNVSIVKPRIRFYEGLDGIKTVLYDTLTCQSKSLLGILSMGDLLEVPGRKEMEDYIARRIATGISLKVLRSREKDVGDIWPTRAADLRELGYVPAGLVFTMTTYIYDQKVSFISSRRENFGMIIESEEFARMHENLFRILWQASQPVPDTPPQALKPLPHAFAARRQKES